MIVLAVVAPDRGIKLIKQSERVRYEHFNRAELTI